MNYARAYCSHSLRVFVCFFPGEHSAGNMGLPPQRLGRSRSELPRVYPWYKESTFTEPWESRSLTCLFVILWPDQQRRKLLCVLGLCGLRWQPNIWAYTAGQYDFYNIVFFPFSLRQVPIPDKDTTYWCQMFKIPVQHEKHHVTKVRDSDCVNPGYIFMLLCLEEFGWEWWLFRFSNWLDFENLFHHSLNKTWSCFLVFFTK